MTDIHDTADLVSKALRRAWQLGQTYWQQADSEHQSHWKKADATQATFDQLVEDTRAAILAANSRAQPAPSEQDESVRKAWSRFSNELHRSPDAPYPGMSQAFEQHFSQSFTDREWMAEAATWAAAWKAAKRHGAQPAPSVPDDVVEQAVIRFLSWKLPKDFHPDGGMVFIPTKGRGYDSPHWPVGTNLLNAQQAREMLRYVLAAAPEAKP